jgi:glycosyltransferase involved in cell wall biosynthesis
MKLNIAMICFNIEGRGTYQRAYNLAVELTKLGHQVTILAANITGSSVIEKSVDSIRIVTFPRLFNKLFFSGWGLYEIMRRILWLRKQRFDLVHSFELRPTCLYPALVLQKRGSVLLTDWADWFGRGGSVEERPNYLIRSFLRPIETYYEEKFRTKAKGTTVICTALYHKAIELGVKPHDLLYLNNGFNNPELHPIGQALARNKIGISADDFLVGYVGSGFSKDMELMHKSFEIISKKIPCIKLLHIGRSNYFVSPHSQIIQTGPVSMEMLNIYLSACNIFWLPLSNINANIGRFPIKLSDYLTIGRPTVSTAVGDLPLIFEKYDIGLLAAANPVNIAEKVCTLYNNQSLLFNISKNALTLSNSSDNSWQARAKELEQFYYRMIGQPGTGVVD